MIVKSRWHRIFSGIACGMALLVAPGCDRAGDEGNATAPSSDQSPVPSTREESVMEVEPPRSLDEAATSEGFTAIGGDEADESGDTPTEADGADTPPRPTGHGLQLPERASVPAETLDDESWLGLLVTAIESAHGHEAWGAREDVHFRARLHVERDDELPVEIVLRHDLSGRFARLDLPDGSVVLRRDDKVWRATGPMGGPPPEAREWIETLPRLLLAPVMLRQPGQRLAADGLQKISETQYLATTLTFTADADVAAHHWYALFVDPFQNRVAIMAYYFSTDHTLDPAWQQQHAAVFDEYDTVDGVTLPVQWRLHKWSRARGVLGDPIGTIRVTSMGFEPSADLVFAPPGNADQWNSIDRHGDESPDAP